MPKVVQPESQPPTAWRDMGFYLLLSVDASSIRINLLESLLGPHDW